MTAAQTMTCPSCGRPGIGVQYRVAKIAGGGKARIRRPAPHNAWRRVDGVNWQSDSIGIPMPDGAQLWPDGSVWIDTGKPCEPRPPATAPPAPQMRELRVTFLDADGRVLAEPASVPYMTRALLATPEGTAAVVIER